MSLPAERVARTPNPQAQTACGYTNHKPRPIENSEEPTFHGCVALHRLLLLRFRHREMGGQELHRDNALADALTARPGNTTVTPCPLSRSKSPPISNAG